MNNELAKKKDYKEGKPILNFIIERIYPRSKQGRKGDLTLYRSNGVSKMIVTEVKINRKVISEITLTF
jgi:hypothetical protein